LYKEGIISQEELRLKLNFNNYIRRFERENTNVLEFGNAIPYQRKIEIINGKLAEYAEADKPASEQNSN
jgi:hypothetical protein